MNPIENAIRDMDPDEALRKIASSARKLLENVDQESRLDFFYRLAEDGEPEKLPALVHR